MIADPWAEFRKKYGGAKTPARAPVKPRPAVSSQPSSQPSDPWAGFRTKHNIPAPPQAVPQPGLFQRVGSAISNVLGPGGPTVATTPQQAGQVYESGAGPARQAQTPAHPDEAQFRQWYANIVAQRNKMGMPLDSDPYNPLHHYDYYAAYKAGATLSPDGHFPSQFKGDQNPRAIVNGIDTKTGLLVAARSYTGPKTSSQFAIRPQTPAEVAQMPGGAMIRSPTRFESLQMDPHRNDVRMRIAAQYLSPQTMAALGLPFNMDAIPTDPVSAGIRGYTRGAVAPLPFPSRPHEGTASQIAETVGEVGGFATGLVGHAVFKYAPPLLKGPLAYVARNFETGAVYNVLDTIVNHYHDLSQMSPKEAAKQLAISAGVGGASFAVTGLGFELLAAGIIRLGPAGLTIMRTIRDAIHPEGSQVPVGVGETTPAPSPRTKRAPRTRPAGESPVLVPPPSEAVAAAPAPHVSAEGTVPATAPVTRPPVKLPAYVGSESGLATQASRDLADLAIQQHQDIRQLAESEMARKQGLAELRGVEATQSRGRREQIEKRTLGLEHRAYAEQAGREISRIDEHISRLRAGRLTLPALLAANDPRLPGVVAQAERRIAEITAGDTPEGLARDPNLPMGLRQYLDRLSALKNALSQPPGIVAPGSQVLAEAFSKTQKAAEELYGSAFRQIAPARAPGVVERPFTEARNQALGERAVYAVKSHNFWEAVTKQIQQLSKGARNNAGVKDYHGQKLPGAIALYIDRMGDPEGFDQAIQDALVKYPALKPLIERMNAMTPAEKAYAEQVILHADRVRGQHLVDEEIIQQARDFHVRHLWEQTSTGQEARLTGGGQLNPRTRFGQQRVYPTITQGIAAGLRPRTLDIVTINKLNDLDTGRAIMAKSIRDALLESGEGKWMTGSPNRLGGADRDMNDWVDLGSTLRIFRHNIVVKDSATGATHAIEQHLYVSPEANEAIRMFYERDPFRDSGESLGRSFLDRVFRYNAYVKQMELSYSFFHDFNLAKVFAFSRPLTALRGMIPTSDRGPGMYQKWGPVADGMKALSGMTPIMERLIRNGLVIGRDNIWDAYYNLTGGEGKWGLNNAVVRARNRALWETLQPALKASDAIITARDGLRKFDRLINPRTRRPWTDDEILAGVAEIMNRKHGGLNWDRYGTTQGMRRILRALILAPDWTLSNVLLGWSAIKPGFLGGGGLNVFSPNTMFSNTVEGWAARQSLTKTAATFFVTLQAVNVMMTGHTTFDNPEGRWYSLQLPWKTKNGRNLYADWILPGELRDLIRIGAAGAGSAVGIATNRQMPPQESIQGAFSFVTGKLSPVVRSTALLEGTKWGGQPLFQPGMTERDKAKAVAGQLAGTALPIPIGLTAIGQMLWGGADPTQTASTLAGAGAVTRGVLVPAQSWQSLPAANKMEFLDSLSSDLRDDFLGQLDSGRITGDAGERFRTYLDRYGFLRRERSAGLPPEERYLPVGARHGLPPISVSGDTSREP